MSNVTESRAVWVIHSGDYENRDIYGVAASLDAAVAYIKGRYGEPYIVDWMEPEGGDDYYTLRGSFSAVQGFSTQHIGEFEIASETVHA